MNRDTVRAILALGVLVVWALLLVASTFININQIAALTAGTTMGIILGYYFTRDTQDRK